MLSSPTPQRALRRPVPQRPTPRVAASGAHHAQIARRLTERDRWLARMLHEHTVLTSRQIAELAFPSLHAANERVLPLYRWRIVDRFQPFIGAGAAPMHYVLDVAGATVLAFEDGLDPAEIGYRHDRAIGVASSLRLAHTVAVNGFFTALVAATRVPGSTGRVRAWWSETRCRRYFGDIVRPDAFGRWHEHGTNTTDEIEFFLEYDWGTEPLSKVTRKLADYARLREVTARTTPVLFSFPTTRRETTARAALHRALTGLDDPSAVPLATTAVDLTLPEQARHPATARWLPLPARREPGRLSLAELARLWPAPPTGHRPSTTITPTARPHHGLRPPSPKAPIPAPPPKPRPPKQPSGGEPT